jgi:DASS family divalent anion:Na+ symporter
VLTWRDCLEYSPAWDTLIWFAILISMSNGLNESGLISTFAGMVGQQLSSFNLGWQVSSGCGKGGAQLLLLLLLLLLLTMMMLL